MRHISITGSLGSGKSVVSTRLKELLNIEIVSIGTIQRKMAQQYGMTTIEFNKYMETHHEIDAELDNFVVKEGEKEKASIFDSRLAWHFVPNSLKIYLYTDEMIAAERVFLDKERIGEGYMTLEESLGNIKRRRESEKQRYLKQYKLDLDDLSNYDVIVDTSHTTIEENARLIEKIYRKDERQYYCLWLSPLTLKPTEPCRDYSRGYMTHIVSKFQEIEDYLSDPIKILFYNNFFYIFDGHKRAINALEHGINLVPCHLLNLNNDFKMFNSLNIDKYVEDQCTSVNIYDWEDLLETIIKTKKNE